MTPEFRHVPARLDAGVISGRLLTYGRDYDVGRFRERIAPRAFGPLETADVIANLQHNRERPVARSGAGLSLVDSGVDVLARIEPAGPYADEARALVESDIVRGLSLEMVVDEDRIVDGVREVRAARLLGLSLVDRPAYDDAVIAARMRETRGTELAAALRAALPDDDEEAVARMAAAAGIEATTVRQILRAEIDIPPLNRLAGFARALNVPLSRLVQAANRDGADYRLARWL